MRLGSFLDSSDRRAAWIRWLIVGLVFLALLVGAARVASADVLPAEVDMTAATDATANDVSCPSHDGHAKGKGCSDALGCHIVGIQPDFAVAHPVERPRFLPRELGLHESQNIVPLFHPPRRRAQA